MILLGLAASCVLLFSSCREADLTPIEATGYELSGRWKGRYEGSGLPVPLEFTLVARKSESNSFSLGGSATIGAETFGVAGSEELPVPVECVAYNPQVSCTVPTQKARSAVDLSLSDKAYTTKYSIRAARALTSLTASEKLEGKMTVEGGSSPDFGFFVLERQLP